MKGGMNLEIHSDISSAVPATTGGSFHVTKGLCVAVPRDSAAPPWGRIRANPGFFIKALEDATGGPLSADHEPHDRQDPEYPEDIQDIIHHGSFLHESAACGGRGKGKR